MKRVAITGLGAICGNGNNLSTIWDSITSGQSGISRLDHKDQLQTSISIGGEIKNFTVSEDLLSEREAPRYDRFIHLSLTAGKEAYFHAGLNDCPYPRTRIGCIMGVGIGGLGTIEKNHNVFLEKGLRRVSPFFIPGIIPNMGAGLLSILYDLQGMNFAISSACASSAHAINSAYYEIALGRHDAVLAGGAESTFSNLGIGGFQVMKALSKNESPKTASRPFDKDRDGFIMGEGSAFVVLEDLEKAKARGAKIYAEIVGYGASADANHITAPHSEGTGASNCMKQALETANISPEQIDYINAHGTSTPLGDIAETKAIKKTFGDHAKNLIVSSTKSMTGHLLGAAGSLETVFCVKALGEGIIPPTINLDNQDPECDLNYCPNKPLKREIEYALNNSFGFGGTNSCLILKKY